MNDITLEDREKAARETPSQEDLLNAWAGIYQAALNDDYQALQEAIGAHSRLLGYKTETAMRKNKERILGVIDMVKSSIGLKAALRRALGDV